MQTLRIFVAEIVAFFRNACKNLPVVIIGKRAMTRSSLLQKVIACEFSVKRVATFGVVLYRHR